MKYFGLLLLALTPLLGCKPEDVDLLTPINRARLLRLEIHEDKRTLSDVFVKNNLNPYTNGWYKTIDTSLTTIVEWQEMTGKVIGTISLPPDNQVLICPKHGVISHRYNTDPIKYWHEAIIVGDAKGNKSRPICYWCLNEAISHPKQLRVIRVIP